MIKISFHTWLFRVIEIDAGGYTLRALVKINFFTYKVCLISPGTDLPGEWALLALGFFPRTFETDFMYYRALSKAEKRNAL